MAAVNTITGEQLSFGRRGGMWTASAYKLLVLVALLLRRQHGSSAGLSGYERELARRAIENSDNQAGYLLFVDLGGSTVLTEVAKRLGMRATVPGVWDPTFTRTGAADYLTLLQTLVSRGQLNRASRAFALYLMRNVEADQRWGVGVVADGGSSFANKNGWLSIDDSNGPDDSDDGLWAVTSAGVVTFHHQQLLLAVFTQHQPDFLTGVRLVERLARVIAPAVAL